MNPFKKMHPLAVALVAIALLQWPAVFRASLLWWVYPLCALVGGVALGTLSGRVSAAEGPQ